MNHKQGAGRPLSHSDFYRFGKRIKRILQEGHHTNYVY